MHSMKPISIFFYQEVYNRFLFERVAKICFQIDKSLFSNRYIQVLRMDKERCIVLHPPCRKMAILIEINQTTQRGTQILLTLASETDCLFY